MRVFVIWIIALAACLNACGSLPPEPPPDSSEQPDSDTDAVGRTGSDVGSDVTSIDSGATDTLQGLVEAMECFKPGVYLVPRLELLAPPVANLKLQAHYSPGFCIDRLEVTRADWASCVSVGKCPNTCASTCKGEKGVELCETRADGTKSCDENARFYCASDPNAVVAASSDAGAMPVRHVTLGEALWFCKQMHSGGRLPTGIEWMIAAWNNPPCAMGLDGSTTCQGKWMSFPWGPAWPPPKGIANLHKSVGADSSDGVAPVGVHGEDSNPVKDLIGNVRELLWHFSIECSGCTATSIHAQAFGGSFLSSSSVDLFSLATVSDTSWHAEDVGFRCATGLVQQP